MTLPNFLIIGAQKAGSSWLAHNIRQHPDVFMPTKEIHFFDKEFNFNQGIQWYKKYFTEASNEKAVGEKTPDYLWVDNHYMEGDLPNIHNRIHKILPEAKLILVLRNPVQRAISAVNHLIRSRRISPMHSIDDLLMGKKRYLLQGYGVLEKGQYHHQITAYQEYFTLEQMLILIYEEDVVQNPELGLKKVCNFLKIDESFQFEELKTKVNDSKISKTRLLLDYYIPLFKPFTHYFSLFFPKRIKVYPSPIVIDKLYSEYTDDNEKLFEFLGKRIDSWQRDVKS
ncbi:sulfotransferase family protein [Gloeocapsopsis dulcis]|uniref:Sulfotransferase domain-containing protein n=1 Tax=Gloeocapsopsis dulcis AAB1 = 1H9 TaxID=1433147 RepID=A0A6N8FW00_9CHRO|nr:sulfotransferase [Gloeocapsopsis dulcis]MUL37298.1 hypothetical protein [Gloeocapsopsis dulcis AAB1 = 1H9]WNN91102.1 sulfotransferase [Gloeocapsopsis dulcis]